MFLHMERSHSKLIQKTDNYVGNAVIIGQKKRMYRLLGVRGNLSVFLPVYYTYTVTHPTGMYNSYIDNLPVTSLTVAFKMSIPPARNWHLKPRDDLFLLLFVWTDNTDTKYQCLHRKFHTLLQAAGTVHFDGRVSVCNKLITRITVRVPWSRTYTHTYIWWRIS